MRQMCASLKQSRIGWVFRAKDVCEFACYGNTSAAAVAIAPDEANRSGRIKRGDYALMFIFGGGLTWTSTVFEW
jgi:3-oxoacyl-[acyl-carrier-protein] synthase III